MIKVKQSLSTSFRMKIKKRDLTMQNKIGLIMLLLSSSTYANYVVVVDKEDNGSYQITEPTEPEIIRKGYIIDFISISSAESRNAHDVTQTTNSHWEEHFGTTNDLVLNAVAGNSTLYKEATGKDTIHWFDPDKTLEFTAQQACVLGDFSESDIQYLDKDGNVVFWTRTRTEGNYGAALLYGKSSDYSDATNTGDNALHPIVHGHLNFDKENNTVSYTNKSTGNYEMNSWVLSNVDVGSITQIKLDYAVVYSSYTGGTCGANLKLEIL